MLGLNNRPRATNKPMAARHLAGIPPSLEVLADGPHRQVDAALGTDQVAHGLAGPRRGGDPQILGAVVVDLLLDAPGLIIRESPAGADGPPGPIAGDRAQAAGDISRPP